MPDASTALPSVDRLAYLISVDLQSDDLGLWEVVWTLNTLAPAAPLEDKIRLARHAVSRLLGHHDLWRGEWPGGPVARLTDDETQTLAHDDTPWRDPEHSSLFGSGKKEPPPALVPSRCAYRHEWHITHADWRRSDASHGRPASGR